MPVVMRCVGAWQEGFEEEVVLPLSHMVYGEVGQSYVALARPEGATLVGKLTNVLKFTVKEIDPTTGVHVLLLCLIECPGGATRVCNLPFITHVVQTTFRAAFR